MNKALKALKEIECRLGRAIGILEREQPTSADIIDCLEAKQPTGAPTRAPEAERPSTCPDVPPEAPRDTRRAWDKMATGSLKRESVNKATEAGEFVKELRKLCYSYEDGWDSKNCPHPLAECAHKLGEACDRLDCLEKEARTTLGTNTRLKAEYNRLEAENKRLKRKLADGLFIDYDVLGASRPEDILDMIRKARKGQK